MSASLSPAFAKFYGHINESPDCRKDHHSWISALFDISNFKYNAPSMMNITHFELIAKLQDDITDLRG